jgi:hypothetical protein
MTEQDLDDADVGARFEQMRGEAMAQRVHGHRLFQFGFTRGHTASCL